MVFAASEMAAQNVCMGQDCTRKIHTSASEGSHLQEDINAEGWEVIWPEDRRGAVFQAKDQFVGVATGGTELASIQGQAPPWALLYLSRCVWSSENPEREVLCCPHMEKGHTAEC